MRRPTAIVALAAVIALGVTACAPSAPGTPPEILLFAGNGSSPNDVAAVKTILIANHLAYATATTSQLNRMTEAQLASYRLLIIPGGNFIAISDGLAPSTARHAVHDAGERGPCLCAHAHRCGAPSEGVGALLMRA